MNVLIALLVIIAAIGWVLALYGLMRRRYARGRHVFMAVPRGTVMNGKDLQAAAKTAEFIDVVAK